MRSWYLLLLCSSLLGCSTEVTQKKSHYDHDHEIPDHWPRDLSDASLKIRDRVRFCDLAPRSEGEMIVQLTELVSWVPEIAADTDLSEQAWIVIDYRVQTVQPIISGADHLTSECREQLENLCVLIDESVAELRTPHFQQLQDTDSARPRQRGAI